MDFQEIKVNRFLILIFFRKKRLIFGTCGISFVQIMHLQTDSICTYTNALCEELIFFDL